MGLKVDEDHHCLPQGLMGLHVRIHGPVLNVAELGLMVDPGEDRGKPQTTAGVGQEEGPATAPASREALDKTPWSLSAQGLSLQMMETFCLAAASILAIITFSL